MSRSKKNFATAPTSCTYELQATIVGNISLTFIHFSDQTPLLLPQTMDNYLQQPGSPFVLCTQLLPNSFGSGRHILHLPFGRADNLESLSSVGGSFSTRSSTRLYEPRSFSKPTTAARESKSAMECVIIMSRSRKGALLTVLVERLQRRARHRYDFISAGGTYSVNWVCRSLYGFFEKICRVEEMRMP